MESIKIIVIVVTVVFCLIEFIINEELRKKIINILNKHIWKTQISIKNICVIVIFIIMIIYSVLLLIEIKENVDYINEDVSEQDLNYEKSQKISNEQNLKYNDLMKFETNIENCKNPYIPNNFRYIEGEWNSGFVVEDENKNQFVWIPCTNLENEENIPVLKKQIFIQENGAKYFNCFEEEDFEEFIKSSLENGGFYISRFEIGKENGYPVSKLGVEIWTGLTWEEAYKQAKKMYENINSKLINGYAYDTAVTFIYNEINLKNVNRSTGITGNKSYKNIYDLVDDCLEWTSEMRYTSKICRGSVFAKMDDIEPIFFADRFSREEALSLSNLGFRTIIYK